MQNNKVTEEQFFSLLEGELNTTEEKELLALIASDELLSKEWEMWQLTLQELDTPKFENKEALLAIAEPKENRAPVLWFKWIGAAAILLLGFISFWMLRNTDKTIDGIVKVNTDSTIRVNPSQDKLVSSNEKQIDVSLLSKEETKTSVFKRNDLGRITKSKKEVVRVSYEKPSAPLAPIDTFTKVKQENVLAQEDADTIAKSKVAVVAAASQEVQVVHGTRVSKSKKRARKLVALRSKAKTEVNQWIEKPQLSFAKGMNSKSALKLGNKKYKLNLKLSNYE